MIQIAEGLNMDASEAATQTFGAIAAKGGGKSYLAGRFVEQLYDAGAPFLVLDPIGNWSALTVASDGKSPGLSVVVLGGERADVPLDPELAGAVGALLVERGISAVLDVSELSKSKRKGYVADLLEALYRAARKKRAPYMVVLEEAQVFAPQHAAKGEERMLGAVTDVVRLGRNYGLGSMLVTQRPQSVSKEVLNQAECLFVGQLRGPQERKAIGGWITEQGADVSAQLKETPALSPGEFFCWSPSWLRVFRKVKVLPKRTFDGSRTPVLGVQALEQVKTKRGVSEAADLLRKLVPAAIQAAQLNGWQEQVTAPSGSEREHVLLDEIQRLSRELREANELGAELHRQLAAHEDRARSVSAWAKDTLRHLEMDFVWLQSAPEVGLRPPAATPWASVARPPATATATFRSVFDADSMGQPPARFPLKIKEPHASRILNAPSNGKAVPSMADLLNRTPLGNLDKGQRAVLGALRWQKGPISKNKLALLSGYSVSGGRFNNVLSQLRTAQYIEGSLELAITREGYKVAPQTPPLPTAPHELFEWWCEQPSVDGTMRKILRVLWEHRARAISKAELARASGAPNEHGGSWNNALGRCRTLGLAVGRGKEKIRLAEELRS